MNDPNGFSFFKGWYHIFYQYYPYAAQWGPMHWGHARSRDLVHWETLPTALEPDENENGCFSGSAVVYDDKLWLIYTGHHTPNAVDPEDFYQDQRVAWSEDGINFTKYGANPVFRTPAGNTKHFRDPKVWQDGDTFMWDHRAGEFNGLRIGADFVPVRNTRLLLHYTFGKLGIFDPGTGLSYRQT